MSTPADIDFYAPEDEVIHLDRSTDGPSSSEAQSGARSDHSRAARRAEPDAAGHAAAGTGRHRASRHGHHRPGCVFPAATPHRSAVDGRGTRTRAALDAPGPLIEHRGSVRAGAMVRGLALLLPFQRLVEDLSTRPAVALVLARPVASAWMGRMLRSSRAHDSGRPGTGMAPRARAGVRPRVDCGPHFPTAGTAALPGWPGGGTGHKGRGGGRARTIHGPGWPR